MQDLRKLILKSKGCPSALWTPDKSRYMWIGRQKDYWRLKLPEYFSQAGSRYVRSEEEAAELLRTAVEPFGLSLSDMERIGYASGCVPAEPIDAPQTSGFGTSGLLLLAETALQQHADELENVLERHRDDPLWTRSSQVFVVRRGSRFCVQVPEDLKSQTGNVAATFPTAQKAHLHIRNLLQEYEYNPDLLFA